MGMFRWDYMINCNEKENDYENKDHIIKKPKRWKDKKYTKYYMSW